jgi:hypothetical protein
MSTVSTRTHNATTTRTRTAIHLTGIVMGSLVDILSYLGIDASQLLQRWETDERAIATWIEERSLKAVILECHRPNGTVDPVIQFPVTYTRDGPQTAEFTASRARLARYLNKLGTVPRGTRYALFCTFHHQCTPQTGWSPGTPQPTDGMRSTSFGTLGRAPDAKAGMLHYSR